MLTFGRCGVSFAQSNCLTDEEIKKVRLLILEKTELDSLLSIAKFKQYQQRRVIDQQSEIIENIEDELFLRTRKEEMLNKQIDYAMREAERHKRRKQIFQGATLVGGLAVGALLILK